MAGKPKQRAWLAKIHELGGWSALLEKRAAGAQWAALAAEVGCSRTFLRYMITKGSEKLREAVDMANKEYAEHLAEESLDIADTAPVSREDMEHMKLRVSHRRWLAGVYDREKFGEPKDKGAAAPISIGELHIQALIQGAPKTAIPARVDAPAQLPSGSSSSEVADGES